MSIDSVVDIHGASHTWQYNRTESWAPHIHVIAPRGILVSGRSRWDIVVNGRVSPAAGADLMRARVYHAAGAPLVIARNAIYKNWRCDLLSPGPGVNISNGDYDLHALIRFYGQLLTSSPSV